MKSTISFWVVGTLLAYIIQCRLGETGIVALVNLPLADSDSPVHEAIRLGLSRWNLFLLPAATFFHGGAMHAFLGSVSLLVTGRIVERIRGRRHTLLLLGSASIVGTASGWVVTGHPSFGASLPFHGLLGAMVLLAARRTFPAPMLWYLSFPLLALAGLFGLAATEMRDLSHSAHLASFLVGVGVTALPWKETSTSKAVAIFLGAWIGAGSILAVGGGVRIARDRGADLRLRGWLEGFATETAFVTHRDPQGRFRISHPAVAEPVQEGREVLIRLRGGDASLLAIDVVERSGKEPLDVVAGKIIGKHREALREAVQPDTMEVVNERPVIHGGIEGRRFVISASTSGQDLTDIVVVYATEENIYILQSAYPARDRHLAGWVERMLDSLEILR